jgi:ribosomal protein S17E
MRNSSLLIIQTPIAEDWDYNNNSGIDINAVYKTSRLLVHWKCINGHKYKTSVFSRVRSNGCKECSKASFSEERIKLNALKGTSFADENPKIVNEWNLARNKFSPNEVTSKSSLKIWFKCNKGHEWMTTPKARTMGRGCPICYKKNSPQIIRASKLKKTGISLAIKHPDLLDEWDYNKNKFTPEELTPNSNYKVFWKCKFNHNWEATINNRTQNKSGCPYCKSSTSKLEVFVLCELQKLFKNVIWRGKIAGFECDVIIEDLKTGIEIDGAYWHDDKLERDNLKRKIFKENGYNLLRLRDYRLPVINEDVVLFDNKSNEVDLVVNLLFLIKKYHPTFEITEYITNKKQIGLSEYKKILSLLPAPTENETLAYHNPALSFEWDLDKNFPLTAEMFSPNSGKKVWWRCKNGHPSWEASIKNRNIHSSGCPICYKENAGTIVRNARLKNSNTSLGLENPDFLNEWDYENNFLNPFQVSSNSGLKVNWKCKSGHIFKMTIKDRSIGRKCPKCFQNNRGEIVRIALLKKSGTNFAIEHPNLLDEWDYELNIKSPEEYSPNSHCKVHWKCMNGHRRMASIESLSKGIGRCIECKSISFQRNDLLEIWDYEKNITFDPNKSMIGSNKKVWWKCDVHGSFQRVIYEMAKNKKCPKCYRYNVEK